MRSPSFVRAAVLLAVVLDPPGIGPAVRRLTGEPRLEQWEAYGVPVEVVRPRGSGPWPTWLFVNGAHPERRAEPVVQRLSRGLARAGYLVLVPDVPGLGEGTITARTLEATAAVTGAATRRSDVEGGRVALIGASTGAALALLTAARAELADHVSIVAAVAPFADLERMVCLATTRGYAESEGFTRYEITALQRRVVARSLVAAITDEAERERLFTAEAAFADAEQVFLVAPLTPDLEALEANAIDSAARAGVRHVVRLSTAGVAQEPVEGYTQPRQYPLHRSSEQRIEGSGMEHTHLRPGPFMQSTLNFAPSIKAEGVFRGAWGDGTLDTSTCATSPPWRSRSCARAPRKERSS